MLADAQRQRFLEAMGIDVYVLRSHAAVPVAEVDAVAEAEKTTTTDAIRRPCLVIVCEPADANSREAADRQHAQILRALGLTANEIEWLHADAKQLEREPPALNAWLVLGEHLARVLGEQLSTQQQNVSVIAVAPALSNAMRSGANKRAFWQALKPLARALRASAAHNAATLRH